MEENPGGSFIGKNLPLKKYIKSYKREGNHVKRYNFARKLLFDKSVIEVGCGYGIGSILMGKTYKSYLGLDVDNDAIEYAISKIKPLNKKTNFGLMRDYFNKEKQVRADVVICFEVIEHVNEPSQFLLQLEALLNDGGVLLISTPNGLSSMGDQTLFRTQYHLKEFTPKEFYELLGSKEKICFYGEKRIDELDVKFLKSNLEKKKKLQSMKGMGPQALSSCSSSVMVRVEVIYKIIYYFLNYQIFWKIYQTNIAHESKEIRCSTLIAKVIK